MKYTKLKSSKQKLFGSQEYNGIYHIELPYYITFQVFWVLLKSRRLEETVLLSNQV